MTVATAVLWNVANSTRLFSHCTCAFGPVKMAGMAIPGGRSVPQGGGTPTPTVRVIANQANVLHGNHYPRAVVATAIGSSRGSSAVSLRQLQVPVRTEFVWCSL